MKNQSVTITGLIVSFLAFILPMIGVEVGTEEVSKVVFGVVEIGGLLMGWYGRVRIGDINLFGKRK